MKTFPGDSPALAPCPGHAVPAASRGTLHIRVLGCSGAIALGSRTTAFLVDDDLLIDAGTGVGELTLDEMARINHVFLTHSHLDHLAAVPLMVDAVASRRAQPLTIHALAGTLDALRAHIFNDVIWPDFTRLPSARQPFIRLEEVTVGQRVSLGGRCLEVLPAMHTVPAAGYAVSAGGGCWVFTGDTGPNPALWTRLNQLEVSTLVIETAFGEQQEDLARRSRHLSPHQLLTELAQRAPQAHYPVYITHLKPGRVDEIMREILAQAQALPQAPEARPVPDIRWLYEGQRFVIEPSPV